MDTKFFRKKNFLDDTNIKAPLQYFLYDVAANFGVINVDSTIVSGPALQRHIYDARNTISPYITNKINIIEIDEKIHNYQKDLLDSFNSTDHRNMLWIDKSDYPNMGIYYTYDKNVECINVSIENAPMTNFIDADLMGAATYTTGQVIRSTFIKQSENVIGNKGFIFTTCLRRSGLEESINGWLRNTILPIIGCDVKKIDLTNKERLTIHKESRISSNHQNNVNHVFKFNNIEINNPGRLEHISLYNYADDGGPMLTGLIVYI